MEQIEEGIRKLTIGQKQWKHCDICDGNYPIQKHNFEECYSLDPAWDLLIMDTDFSILREPHVIDWFNCVRPHNHIDDEKKWGNNLIKKYCGSKKKTCQWTTLLGEYVVSLLLMLNGHTIIEKQKHKGYDPDIETTDCIYEVKSRNYNTTGTAGEKILGVSKKYADVPILFGKPVVIVLCGYQEIEGMEKFNLFNPHNHLKKMLEFDKQLGFTYLRCSDLLQIIIS
jgi:hypothetical protein